MTPASRFRWLLAAPGLALACGAVAVVLETPNRERLLSAILAGIGVLLLWGVAVLVQLRYPERPLGKLLFVLAAAYAVQTLIASPNPVLYSLARAVRPGVEVLLVWVMLAFPSGRLQGRPARAVVLVGALSVVLLWIPSLLFSPQIPMVGTFVFCRLECPRNILFILDRSALSHALNMAFRTVGALLLVATMALLFDRLRKGTPLLRQALGPVLLASIGRTVAMAGFLISDGLTLPVVLTFWAIPLAMAWGLLRGRLYMSKALERLVTGLRTLPSAGQLRQVMASALDDPTLSIVYWVKSSARWIDADGNVVALPYPSPMLGRAVRVVNDAQGNPVASLIHDIALLETPSLVDAVAGSMLIALEGHRVFAELKTSRAGTATAVAQERRRIERDLHDGAQQRLIALRMKLGVTARLMDVNPRQAAGLVAELGADVDAAIKELRDLAHGVLPAALVELGLAGALTDVAHRVGMQVRVEVQDVGRLDAGIESAVYFCCIEALQNAAKHAGPAATVTLSMQLIGSVLQFGIADDGKGATLSTRCMDGQGLANMRERIEAVGGKLEIAHVEGSGFAVSGTVYLPLG